MPLYPFQERVYDVLSSGRSAILQAPTGAGKTRAALYPFLRGWEYETDFPRKCIYSVPLRVLADQFEQTYSKDVANFGFRRELTVGIQTGARPDDTKLEANLIFTTVDQTLSSILTIPYALSLAQGNLNAGAVLQSYLVFDELHLFDPKTMLPTVLHFLHMVRGIVPFLVMTATLSADVITALARKLGAEPIILTPDEAAAIPSQHKTRRLHTVEAELTPEVVLEKHQRRSVAICNTVGRAQVLFEGLKKQAGSAVEVRLLHSRFLPGDRQISEAWLRSEFGKDKTAYTVESAILVATQVVEVGLDITSETLHTELAPASSVIQRAGRCARYKDEMGDVYVYRLPLDKTGKPNYAPYLAEQRPVCEKTWEALNTRSGMAFDFGMELDVVNEAHAEADQQILARLRAQRFAVQAKIARTIEAQEQGAARELIRDIDSCTVIVHPEPQTLATPWAYEGFGLYRGTLLGAYQGLVDLQAELGLPWALMTAEPEPDDAETSCAPTRWRWREIESKQDLTYTLLVVVHPYLAHYSPETGFQLGVPSQVLWASPRRERKENVCVFPPYKRETFQEHVARMLRVYTQPFYDAYERRMRLPLESELAYVAAHLEAQQGWEPGTLDRLARLVIALHDVGKLDRQWQAWAHRWQRAVSAVREEDLTISNTYLAAHTDYNGEDEAEKLLNRKLGRTRPNHAVESAQAAENVIWDAVGREPLVRAALSAIARHHSAGARGNYGAFEASPEAEGALADVLGEFDPAHIKWQFPAGTLASKLMRPDNDVELLVYLLLVRILRLADQRSQEV